MPAKISAANVSLNQGINAEGLPFGYVDGDGGGYFFDWHKTLDATIASVNMDEVDGDGGLDVDDVREFLRGYLPDTPMGRRRDWHDPADYYGPRD